MILHFVCVPGHHRRPNAAWHDDEPVTYPVYLCGHGNGQRPSVGSTRCPVHLMISIRIFSLCGSCLTNEDKNNFYSPFVPSRPTSAGCDPDGPWPAWIPSCAWFYTCADDCSSESSRCCTIASCSSTWTVTCGIPPDQQTTAGSS